MKEWGKFRFLIPNKYELLKYGGIQAKDLSYGMKKILEYLPKDQFSEELIKENLEKYSLEKMLEQIQYFFRKEYEFSDSKVELNNRYQGNISSYVCEGEKEGENSFIHIDELYEAAVLSFFLSMFKWTKEFDNLETYGFGFIHALYTLNDVSILGRLPDANASETLLRAVNGDLQVINLAEDCYWTITAFNLAHELAHIYLNHDKKGGLRRQTKKQSHQEEFQADAIAYDIVLKMIIDGKRQSRNERLLEEYTFLAPVMFMDYVDLIYYTDRVLYQAYIGTETHPEIQKRKESIFKIPYEDIYELDTEEGNRLYNGFLDVYDEYRTQLLMKKQLGKLESIIDPERKREKRREYEQGRSGEAG